MTQRHLARLGFPNRIAAVRISQLCSSVYRGPHPAMLQSTSLLLLAWHWLLQVDAAVAPFVLRLRVLEGLGNYKVPEGEPLGRAHNILVPPGQPAAVWL